MGIEIGPGITVGPGITFNNITVPAIGDPYGGGFFAGQISVNGNGIATHNLVVGPLSTAQASRAWKTTNTSTPNTGSVIDGPSNSAAMNNSNHPAAFFCEGLTVGGFSDWYLPAKDELEVIYFNLKPGTATNFTTYGANPYAVPPRVSNYTTTNPAQTTAVAFRTGGAEAFTAIYNWSSTQIDATYAGAISFNHGEQVPDLSKTNSSPTRAVRRVPV